MTGQEGWWFWRHDESTLNGALREMDGSSQTMRGREGSGCEEKDFEKALTHLGWRTKNIVSVSPHSRGKHLGLAGQ